MEGHKTVFTAIVALVAMLLVPMVLAQPTFTMDVEVEGVAVDSNTVVYAERGSTADIMVRLISDEDASDIRVNAWVGGYEYDVIESESKIFDLPNNTIKAIPIKLQLPSDMDASETYTLHIDVLNGVYSSSFVTSLRVEEIRHLTSIQDVILSPTTIEAGQPLFVTVRVENIGDKKEENIKVTASIPALGISARSYIEELTAHETSDEEDIESSGSTDIVLQIPDNAVAGIYDVKIDVEYDRSHEIESATYKVDIKSQSTTITVDQKEESAVTITPDITSQEVEQGKSAVFKISFANKGLDDKVVSLEASGDVVVRVDPSILTIRTDDTAEAFVYVATTENTAEGLHMFTVKVKSNDKVIKEINFGTQVVGKPSGWEGAKQVLEIAFIALLVILVILALVIVVKKLRGSEEGIEEPEELKGQTYY